MAYFMGIDLGSTTSKAIIIDNNEKIIGEGLTNTRSNYSVAVSVAAEEAMLAAKINFLILGIKDSVRFKDKTDSIREGLILNLERYKFSKRIERFREECSIVLGQISDKSERDRLSAALEDVFGMMNDQYTAMVADIVKDRSLFFRDVLSNSFMKCVENVYSKHKLSYEAVMNVFDKAIIPMENDTKQLSFLDGIDVSLKGMKEKSLINDEDGKYIYEKSQKVDSELTIEDKGGTGYGRQLLPFPKEKIYSEILCHGLGSHYYFPGTRTVLDIGGQDTKAIQIDDTGMVTSFSMNDRCAAGCGRYLGYIADQLSLNINELSPLAQKSKKLIKISSTCTVFAGAELRHKLNLGEKVEDLIYSLEFAMIKRAMSLISRAGGISNEFTFSGGVAKNKSITEIVGKLVSDNYSSSIKMNVSQGSIFSGALGAAIFAKRRGVTK